MGRAFVSGLSDLCHGLAETQGQRAVGPLVSLADQVGSPALRLRAGDVDWNLGLAQRLYRHGPHLVDRALVIQFWAPHRAFAADHPRRPCLIISGQAGSSCSPAICTRVELISFTIRRVHPYGHRHVYLCFRQRERKACLSALANGNKETRGAKASAA